MAGGAVLAIALAAAYSKHEAEMIITSDKQRSSEVLKAAAAAVPSMGYESCIVSFIDVLGFRELLKRPAGEVLKVLNLLRDFTKPQHEEPIRRMKDARLVSRAFAESVSDAVVRLRVYETQFRDGAFFLELINLLHAQIECVNAGVLIRAGVAIGPVHVGVNGEGPFFGAGMVRAFKIESEEAVFPRIVVDDAAYDAFLADEQLRSEDNDLEEEREHVDRLLRVGEDGTRFIDYLRAAQTEMDDQASYLQFLDRHALLIRSGLDDAVDSLRIRRKYLWLARYHNEVVEALLGGLRRGRAARDFEAEWDFDGVGFLEAARVEV